MVKMLQMHAVFIKATYLVQCTSTVTTWQSSDI